MLAPLSRRAALLLPLIALPLLTAGCQRGVIDNELAAELAYLGLDRAIDRMIDLGFDGFNAANSANIPTQYGNGDEIGDMEVGGQVDQGASANKGMRLEVTLSNYSDGPVQDTAIYYTGGPGNADFMLKGLPDADFDGTFNGVYTMDGDLAGTVELNLQIAGQTADTGDGTIARVPGTITVVGTATSDYGVFDVNVSL
ncbi:MAG: hypothetical protein KC486_02960 [Myxococcales bacterium]|nr:hypothetical protein [Myxococcales bacterium]